jgi:hypothetical protein
MGISLLLFTYILLIKKIKDNLMFLIKMAKELKAEFVYPSDLFE